MFLCIFEKQNRRMNLIVDIGNTLVKVAVFQNDKLIEVDSMEQNLFEKKINYFFKTYPKISHSILSSVQEHPLTWEKILQQKTCFIKLTSATPVFFSNRYLTPNTLGIDRIALVASAAYNFPNKNVLVIDAGTCITYDFLNKTKEYLGGAISPGIKMRAKAMHQYTGKLPLVELNMDIENKILGKNTQQCMQIGVLKATSLEIDGFIEEYKDVYEDLTIILTGGDSQVLSKNVKNSIFASSNFLIEGLNQILEFNK
ncbi:type III pantothenate kinase [Mesonia phycicola]|uniref:Type III pantothenate kinase n=1 Tax=Mesonia phycicola TaxID=579105 RepID=A0A1M6CJ22_9FLAO|nr:type III pantothenate kinase [Mesonia phycicola]SHI60698.1 type III pantothenate kinase [Mesonia phycicola]